MDITPHVDLLGALRQQNLQWKSLISELVDNSFDAGATRVEITYGPGKRLEIRDDGVGCKDISAMLTLGGRRQRAAGGDRTSKKRAEKALKDNCPEALQGQSRDAAGALLGVSGKQVDRASTVLAKGSPALIAAVESGELSVSRAATIAKTVPKAKQAQAITEKPKHTAPTPYEQLCKWWDLADASARARFRLYQDE